MNPANFLSEGIEITLPFVVENYIFPKNARYIFPEASAST